LAIPTGRKNSFYLKYDKKIMGLSYNVPWQRIYSQKVRIRDVSLR
jgi:hypothetical protein